VKPIVQRGLVVVGWLLTPVVAWAVSFLGAWLGALLGTALGDTAALMAIGTGAVIGAVAGAVTWVRVTRAVTKYFISQSNREGSR